MSIITINLDSIESVAKAIRDGITTPELLADYLGEDLVEDCLVLPESPVYADCPDAHAETDYQSDTDPEDAAKEYVESGVWDRSQTQIISVITYRKGIDDRGRIINVDEDRHTITLQPEEPDCSDPDGHQWESPYDIVGGCQENPGVFGHGGGVTIQEVCVHCGCGCETDTWATNPSDGTQGHTVVQYTPGQYAEAISQDDHEAND